MYNLQTTVTVEGKVYNIRKSGDFRMVLDCFETLNDKELGEDFRVLACLIIFYEGLDSLSILMDLPETVKNSLIAEMYKFFNGGKTKEPGVKTEVPLISWSGDSEIICAAVNTVAGKEVRAEPYLHWWTFSGYYLSVGESVLSTVVSIRSKLVKGKKLEDWEKEFRMANPDYFNWRDEFKSAEEKQVEDDIIANFYKKGDT